MGLNALVGTLHGAGNVQTQGEQPLGNLKEMKRLRAVEPQAVWAEAWFLVG